MDKFNIFMIGLTSTGVNVFGAISDNLETLVWLVQSMICKQLVFVWNLPVIVSNFIAQPHCIHISPTYPALC